MRPDFVRGRLRSPCDGIGVRVALLLASGAAWAATINCEPDAFRCTGEMVPRPLFSPRSPDVGDGFVLRTLFQEEFREARYSLPSLISVPSVLSIRHVRSSKARRIFPCSGEWTTSGTAPEPKIR